MESIIPSWPQVGDEVRVAPGHVAVITNIVLDRDGEPGLFVAYEEATDQWWALPLRVLEIRYLDA